LLDLESAFIAALRQKKVPEVAPAARDRAAALARRAAASDVASLPRPEGEDDASLLSFLERSLERYAVWCRLRREHPGLSAEIRAWVSFRLPEALDSQHLVRTERPDPRLPEARVGPADRRRRREGFLLTDPRMTRRETLGEAHYCLLCHDREKDSCSR